MKASRPSVDCRFILWPDREGPSDGRNWKTLDMALLKTGKLAIWASERVDGVNLVDLPDEVLDISADLRTKTALLFCELLPPAIYADALQEEIPEAEWAAQHLREWAKWVEK